MNNDSTPFEWNEDAAILMLRYLDGDLSAEETVTLFKMLEEDGSLREQYVDLVVQHQAIIEGGLDDHSDKLRAEVLRAAGQLEKKQGGVFPRVTGGSSGWQMPTFLVFSVVVACITGWMVWSANNQPEFMSGFGPGDSAPAVDQPAMIPVATISRALGSDLEAHTGLTSDDQLAAGDVVSFGAGVVEVEFEQGAMVVLTGPAKMRVDGIDAATLFFGRLAANVKEEAIGFKVLTPDAEVTDLGTEFAVVVPEDGQTRVKVISGIVDLAPGTDPGNKTRLNAGDARRVNGDSELSTINSDSASFDGVVINLQSPNFSIPATRDAYVIGGRFADTVQHQTISDKMPFPEAVNCLLVKHDMVYTNFNRIGLMGFDLGEVDRDKVVAARLVLNVVPNTIAESKEPDHHVLEADRLWRFSVHGVWDDGIEDWNEQDVTWNTTPGIDHQSISGEMIGSGAPMLLGQFYVRGEGVYGDEVVIEGKELVDFLRSDQDGNITMLLRRLSGDIRSGKHDHTIHGFAGREHPDLAPATLEIWTVGQQVDSGGTTDSEQE